VVCKFSENFVEAKQTAVVHGHTLNSSHFNSHYFAKNFMLGQSKACSYMLDENRFPFIKFSKR